MHVAVDPSALPDYDENSLSSAEQITLVTMVTLKAEMPLAFPDH